jgi:hypothetical protein
MCKRELFNEVFGNVCRSLELDRESVMHSNKEECVDARYILIKLLSDIGLTDIEIAETTGFTRQCVNYAKNHFRERLKKWSVRMVYSELKATFAQTLNQNL